MEIALTWNLVLVSAFVMLFAYNLLLGQSSTIKLIISIYISILAADGIAAFFKKVFIDLSPGVQAVMGEHETEVFSAVRIILLLVSIIILVIKSGFVISVDRHSHWGVRTGVHIGFAVLSAILFLATILIYLSGSSFSEGMLFAREIHIYEQSLVAQILIDYYQLWFTLPALAFVGSSFFFESKE